MICAQWFASHVVVPHFESNSVCMQIGAAGNEVNFTIHEGRPLQPDSQSDRPGAGTRVKTNNSQWLNSVLHVRAGWTTLTRAFGSNFPLALTTISSRPNSAIRNTANANAMMMRMDHLGAGCTGASINSRFAGRKASSWDRRGCASSCVRAAQAARNRHRLADKLNQLLTHVAQVAHSEPSCNVRRQLTVPPPNELRLDRHGLDRFSA